MTPLPKKKRSKSGQTNRKLAFRWQPTATNRCSNCGVDVVPHTVCANCGYYRGREVVKIKEAAVVRKVTTNRE